MDEKKQQQLWNDFLQEIEEKFEINTETFQKDSQNNLTIGSFLLNVLFTLPTGKY